MYMTPLFKSLLTFLFNAAVIALVSVLMFLLVQWAAVYFGVPFGIIQVIGFIIFLYAVYRIGMLGISFLESANNL